MKYKFSSNVVFNQAMQGLPDKVKICIMSVWSVSSKLINLYKEKNLKASKFSYDTGYKYIIWKIIHSVIKFLD